MFLTLTWGDTDITQDLNSFSVIEPSDLPTNWCYNHSYAAAGTYDVFVQLVNNRSQENVTNTIEIDATFDCSVTFNHSEFGVADAYITLTAVDASRTAATVDFGDNLVLAEGYNGTECFDPSIGTRTWQHNYEAPGVYDVEINMSNSVDSCMVTGVVGVNERIQGLDITSQSGGSTNKTDATFFRQTLTNGSHLVCERFYDDELVEINYCETPPSLVEFNHTYTEVGIYNIEIICYNYLSEDSFYFIEFVQEPIIGFIFNDTEILTYGGTLQVGFEMAQGTNVTVTGSFNGQSIDATYAFGETVGIFDLNEASYTAGIFTFDAVAENNVSRLQDSIEVQIEKEVAGVMINGEIVDTYFIIPDSSKTFALSTTEGTFPEFHFDYGDGVTSDSYQSGTDEGVTTYTTNSHDYSTPGYFTLNFTARNNVSAESVSAVLGVENPVLDFDIQYTNVTEAPSDITFTVPAIVSVTPTSTEINIIINDVSEITETIDFSTSYDYTHNFIAYGMHTVVFNISNNVSFLEKTVAVKVGLLIDNLQFVAPECANTSELVAFDASIVSGSDVTFLFDPSDGTATQSESHPSSYDFNTAFSHTFTHTFSIPDAYVTVLNATSQVSPNEPLQTHAIKIQNPLTSVVLLPVTPQIITSSATPARFVFSQGTYDPTNATCSYTFDVDNAPNSIEEDVPMDFQSNEFVHEHIYANFGDYNVAIACENCVSSKELLVQVQVDEEITGAYCTTAGDSITSYPVSEAFSIVCDTAAGSRVQYFLDDGSNVLHEDVGQARQYTFENCLQSTPDNYTYSLTANNSASSDSTSLEIQIQHPVQGVSVTTGGSCTNAVEATSTTFTVNANSPYPTDPFIEWEIDTVSSGSKYSSAIMESGTDSLVVAFTDSDVGNHTLAVTLKNLVSEQSDTIDVMVQKEITSFTMETASGSMYIEANEDTYFVSVITGSHAALAIVWGDGVQENIYFDGILTDHQETISHRFATIGSIVIEATADNCFTTDNSMVKTLNVEVQEKIDMDNFHFDIQNPLTNDLKKLEFQLNMTDEFPKPTRPVCNLTYVDTDGVQYDVTINEEIFSYPWKPARYIFPENVNVMVNLTLSCANNVSEDTYPVELILVQEITNLAVVAPSYCTVHKACNFSITLDQGNNIDYEISMGDSTPDQLVHITPFMESYQRSYVYTSQQQFNIYVLATNTLGNQVGDTAVEIQSSLEDSCEIKFGETDNQEDVSSLTDQRILIRIICTQRDFSECPKSGNVMINEVGSIQSDDVSALDFTDFVSRHEFPIIEAKTYYIRVNISNDVSEIYRMQSVLVQDPVRNLKVTVSKTNSPGSTYSESPSEEVRFSIDDSIDIKAAADGEDIVYDLLLRDDDGELISRPSSCHNLPNALYQCTLTLPGSYDMVLQATNPVNQVDIAFTIASYSRSISYFKGFVNTNVNKREESVVHITELTRRNTPDSFMPFCFKYTFTNNNDNSKRELVYGYYTNNAHDCQYDRNCISSDAAEFVKCEVLVSVSPSGRENHAVSASQSVLESDNEVSCTTIDVCNAQDECVVAEMHMGGLFGTIGDYTVKAELCNANYMAFEEYPMKVEDYRCDAPTINYNALAQNGIGPSRPFLIRRAATTEVKTQTYLEVLPNCDDPELTEIDNSWQFYETSTGFSIDVDMGCIEQYSTGFKAKTFCLLYGKYQVNFTATVKTTSFSSYELIYFDVISSGEIKVGAESSINQVGFGNLGFELSLKVEDPDKFYYEDSGYAVEFDWYCQKKGEGIQISLEDFESAALVNIPDSQIVGNGCFGTGVGIISDFTSEIAMVNTTLLEGASPNDESTFEFTVRARMPRLNRTSISSTFSLKVLPGPPAKVIVNYIFPGASDGSKLPRINPQEDFQLEASCDNCNNREKYNWFYTQSCDPTPCERIYINLDEYKDSDSGNILKIPAEAEAESEGFPSIPLFTPGQSYTIRVDVKAFGLATGTWENDIFINRAPIPVDGGGCSVNIREGTACTTEFIIECSEWYDDGLSQEEYYPETNGNDLKYEYFYQIKGNSPQVIKSDNGQVTSPTTFPKGYGANGEIYLFVDGTDQDLTTTRYRLNNIFVTDQLTDDGNDPCLQAMDEFKNLPLSEMVNNIDSALNMVEAFVFSLTVTSGSQDPEVGDGTPEDVLVNDVDCGLVDVRSGCEIVRVDDSPLKDCSGTCIIRCQGETIVQNNAEPRNTACYKFGNLKPAVIIKQEMKLAPIVEDGDLDGEMPIDLEKHSLGIVTDHPCGDDTCKLMEPILIHTSSRMLRNGSGHLISFKDGFSMCGSLNNPDVYIETDDDEIYVILAENQYAVKHNGEFIIHTCELIISDEGKGLVPNILDPSEYVTSYNGAPLIEVIGSHVGEINGELLTKVNGEPIVAEPGQMFMKDCNGSALYLNPSDNGEILRMPNGTTFHTEEDCTEQECAAYPNGNKNCTPAFNGYYELLTIGPGMNLLRYSNNSLILNQGFAMVVSEGSHPIIIEGVVQMNKAGAPYVLPSDLELETSDENVVLDELRNPVMVFDGIPVITDVDGTPMTNGRTGNYYTITQPAGTPRLTLKVKYETDDQGVKVDTDENGNPRITNTFRLSPPITYFTDPYTGDVVLNENSQPIQFVDGTKLQFDAERNEVVYENGNPIIIMLSCQGIACEQFIFTEGQVLTDGQGSPCTSDPCTEETTPAPLPQSTPEEVIEQQEEGRIMGDVCVMIMTIAKSGLSPEMALSAADTLGSVIKSVPDNSSPDDKLKMLLAGVATSQLASNGNNSDIAEEVAFNLGNAISFVFESLLISWDRHVDQCENAQDCDANEMEAAAGVAEARLASQIVQKQQAAEASVAFMLNIARQVVEIMNDHGLSIQSEKMGETGAELSAGDANVNLPATANPESPQGQDVIAQLGNNEVNVYSWDDGGSASEVEGAISMNFYATDGTSTSPYPSEQLIDIGLMNSQLPTRIDFTNETYDNITGMLYAQLEIPTEHNSFVVKINRPIGAVQEQVNFSVAILFNTSSVNMTDFDDSETYHELLSLNRPNLTHYDAIIHCFGSEDMSLALSCKQLVQEDNAGTGFSDSVTMGQVTLGVFIWDKTLQAPEESDSDTTSAPASGIQRRSLVDNITIEDHSLRDIPYFDLYVMLLRCRSFDGQKWVADYCKVGMASDMSQTVCLCPLADNSGAPIQSFSGGSTGPQVNSIDFANLWANFGALLLDSWIVWCTELILFISYTVLAVYVRRKDKADIQKWTVLPLADNQTHHNYFYKISVYTGLRQGATTTSTVCFILSGENSDTGLRILSDGKKKKFGRGTVRHFVMSAQHSLGHLSFCRIWHDTSGRGENASWFLDKIEIEDLQTTYRYFFLCSRWLAVDEDDCQVQRMLPVANEDEIKSFNHLFNTTARNKLSDEHLWVSVLSRPTRSNFSRVQRLSCCLLLLFTTMIANAMFYRDSSEEGDGELDPIAFRIGSAIVVSRNTILISIYGTLAVVPINMIVVSLFRKSKPKYNWDLPQDIARRSTEKNKKAPTEKQVRDVLFPSDKSKLVKGTGAGLDPDDDDYFLKKKPVLPDLEEEEDEEPIKPPKKKKWWKQKYPLPYWGQYISWVIMWVTTILSAIFITLYGMEWGFDKSARWLTSILLSFFQSTIIIQPIKVIAIAMLISCIFKKLDSDDDDLDSEERRHNVEALSDEELLEPTIPDGEKTYFIPEPPDESIIRAARQKREYDKMMFAVLKEIFFYMFFLVLICFIAWGTKDDMVYQMTKGMHEQFHPVPEIYSASHVSDGFKFWSWAKGTMLNALYNSQDYNLAYNSIGDRQYMSDQTSYKIGSPRLRQLRMSPDTCSVLNDFQGVIMACKDAYSMDLDEERHYDGKWNKLLSDNYTENMIKNMDGFHRAFTYQSVWDLAGLPYWGKHGMYSGGGYIADLSKSPTKAFELLKELQQKSWIDRYTRAIFLEVTVYNANINLFAHVEYLFEFTAMGGVMPFLKIQGFQLYPNSGPWGDMILAAQVLYIFILIYFMYHEFKQIREQGCRDYISEPWNLYEVILIASSICCIVMYASKLIYGKVLTSSLGEDIETYTNYMTFTYYDEALSYVIGTIVFLANMKFLRLLRFNRHIVFLTGTIRKAGVELICFSITFFIFFCAYGLMGTVIFGHNLQGFRTFLHSLTSLYSMLLGKFDFMDIRMTQPELGPLYFVTFVMFVYFVLVNMFLGILGIAFYEVRTDTAPNECDKVQFMSFTREQAGYISESLSETVKAIATKEKADDEDEDDEEERTSSEQKLVDEESIQLGVNESPDLELPRPESQQSMAFGARPYLE